MNEEKLAWQCRKLLWIMVVLQLLDWTSRSFSVVEGNSTNTCIHAFSFLVAESPWNSVSKAKLLLPIIPIGIVAYSFTLLYSLSRNNLCRNSWILNERKGIWPTFSCTRNHCSSFMAKEQTPRIHNVPRHRSFLLWKDEWCPGDTRQSWSLQITTKEGMYKKSVK